MSPKYLIEKFSEKIKSEIILLLSPIFVVRFSAPSILISIFSLRYLTKTKKNKLNIFISIAYKPVWFVGVLSWLYLKKEKNCSNQQ